jgi:thiosulfate dehydrogenase [quinone] large subunit
MPYRLPMGYGLALIRAGAGAYFLSTGYGKLTGNWLNDGQPLTRMLRGALPRATPWYGAFLRGTVLPHAALFARLTTLAELVVGITLLLGLFTQAGAILGVFLNLNYMLMKGLASGAGSIDRLFVLSELVFLVFSAGLVLGLDGLLWRQIGSLARSRRERSGGRQPSSSPP